MRLVLACLSTLPLVAVTGLEALGAVDGLSVLSGTIPGEPMTAFLGVVYGIAWFSMWTLTPITALAIAFDTLLRGRSTRCAEGGERVSFTA